jgi:heme exporter protein A
MKLKLSGVGILRGEYLVCSGVSFDAAAGDVIALRGPNGSGKTTLLRSIAGLVRPSAGSISLTDDAGMMIEPDARGDHLHLLGHRDQIKPSLSVAAHLTYAAGLGGVKGVDAESVLDRVGLKRLVRLPAGVMSAGQRRRLGLARLIAVPRPLWLLDEPLSALDADGRALVQGLLEDHRRAGGITIAATHEDLGVTRVRDVLLGQDEVV